MGMNQMRAINKQGSNLAFAKSLPIYAVWLCVYASGSVITDKIIIPISLTPYFNFSRDFIATTFCPITLMIVSCLHLGQYRGEFSSTVSGRTLIRILLLQIGHSTHFSFSNAPPPCYLISQTGGNLAFAKPLPVYAVWLCVYASGSVITFYPSVLFVDPALSKILFNNSCPLILSEIPKPVIATNFSVSVEIRNPRSFS